MKVLALLIGFFVMAVGLVGIVAPSALVSVGEYAVTRIGLYVVGALRIGIGIVLIKVASTSRAPNALRVFGIIALVAGLTTVVVGVDRARALLAWESALGPAFIRFGAGVALVFGGFIAFAVRSSREQPGT